MAYIPFLHNAYFTAKVGIGTDDPDSQLEVYYDAAGSTGAQIKLGSGDVGYETTITNYRRTTDSTFEIASYDDTILGYNRSTDKTWLGIGTNVGIGTTDPNQKLSVKGVINSDANDDYYGAWLSGNSNGTANNYLGLGPWYSTAGYVSYVYNNRLKIYTYDATEHVTLQEAGGFVGIGTIAPRGLLEIGSGGSLGAVINKKISAIIDGGYSTTNSLQYNVTSFIGTTLTETSTDIFDQTGSETDKNFYTGLISSNSYFNGSRYSVVQGGAERLTVARGGNVGIGDTTPSSKLHVAGVVTIDGSQGGTAGSVAIQDNYSGTNHLGNIGWNRSAGGPYLAYGIKQDGSADWKSTFSNFSGMRSYMKLDNNEMQLAWAPAQATTVGDAITGLLSRFTFQLDNGTLKLNAYDGVNKTGTPTYLLGTDGSGNIVKTLPQGSGTAGPYLPLAGGRMTTTSKIEFYNASQYIYANSVNDLTLASGDDINFQTNFARFFNAGVETARISATTNSWLANGSNAKLGINRTDPSYTLDVNGTLRVTSNIITGSALFSNQDNTDVDTGTETVANVAIATYTAAFFDFVIKKGLNVRSGTVYACHDGDTTPLVAFTETSTQDLGDTSDVTLSVDISGTNMRLRATSLSESWSVKSLIRAI